ncbi:hypothetical protein JZ751_006545, partial [Albula glossodonta]
MGGIQSCSGPEIIGSRVLLQEWIWRPAVCRSCCFTVALSSVLTISSLCSPANKLSDHGPRRGSTLNRKQHASPAFQPPLPPVEVGGAALVQCGTELQSPTQAPPPGLGSDACQQGVALGAALATAMQQLLAQHAEESSSSKPREPNSTPPSQRNGGTGVQMSTPSTPGQLSVGAPQAGSMGPSPHTVRRGQPSSQTHSSPAANQPSAQPPKPSSCHSPTGQGPNQSTPQPSATPRRHSSNQPPIQAPSHPPPQPPTQVTPPPHTKSFPAVESATEQSPPSTPTPPDTPPPASAPPDSPCTTSFPPFQSGSLPRPRPVPKPRHRPNVPPPPQPPTSAPDNTNGVCSSNSKIITDSSVAVKGLSRAFVPELAVEQQAAGPAGRETSTTPPKDTDLDSESTAFQKHPHDALLPHTDTHLSPITGAATVSHPPGQRASDDHPAPAARLQPGIPTLSATLLITTGDCRFSAPCSVTKTVMVLR